MTGPGQDTGSWHLVIDQGGHSTRIIVFAEYGKAVLEATRPIDTWHFDTGYIEQSAEQILESARDALNEIALRLKPDELARIKSAACIVQRSSMLACHRQTGLPLSPVISWQDTRNSAFIDDLEVEPVRNLTGLMPNAHYGASKMRWLLDNDPAVMQAAEERMLIFLPLAAYVSCQLVGSKKYTVDPVIASRMLLCELGQKQWSQQMMSMFGLDESMLPVIVASDTCLGQLQTGSHKIPLCLVGGDQSFVPFSAGIPVEANSVFINVGTGAFIQSLYNNEPVDQRLLLSPAVVADNDAIIMIEGTVNAAASALDWYLEQQHKQLSYDEINGLLTSIHDVPIFLNTLAGTGSPYWLPKQEPTFYGYGDNEQKLVAVLESIIFSLNDNLALMKQAKPDLCQIIVSGGMSQLDAFCQKLANMMHLEVIRYTDVEASARGAAIYLQHLDNKQAIESFSGKVDYDHFLPALDEELQKRYQSWCELIQLSISPASAY